MCVGEQSYIAVDVNKANTSSITLVLAGEDTIQALAPLVSSW